MLKDGEKQQWGFNVWFIYKEIIECINTTVLYLNPVTVQLLILEHAVLFLASVSAHMLFAPPGPVPCSPWSCLLVKFQPILQDAQASFLLLNSFHYYPPGA